MTETTLTPLGEKILEILKESADWSTRRQLANALNRPKEVLSPHDVSTLKILQQNGLIEAARHQTGTVKFEWRYRAK